MIWVDRVAIGAFVLTALALLLVFATSDAPLREAQYNAKMARFNAACGLRPRAETKAAPAPESAPSPTIDPGDGSTAEPEYNSHPAPPADSDAAPSDGRLPSSVCNDTDLAAERDAEAAAVKAQTFSDVVRNIGKAGLFFILPVWAGLRVLDFQTGGPKRRLARNAYWQTKRPTRQETRRQRRRSSQRTH